jgi:hypothetical protein
VRLYERIQQTLDHAEWFEVFVILVLGAICTWIFLQNAWDLPQRSSREHRPAVIVPQVWPESPEIDTGPGLVVVFDQGYPAVRPQESEGFGPERSGGSGRGPIGEKSLIAVRRKISDAVRR